VSCAESSGELNRKSKYNPKWLRQNNLGKKKLSMLTTDILCAGVKME